MGEHKLNGTSLAKAAGKQVREVQVAPLGEDCGLVGFGITTAFTQDSPDGPVKVSAVLVATGGRTSQVAMSFESRTVVVRELYTDTVEHLRELLMPPKETDPGERA